MKDIQNRYVGIVLSIFFFIFIGFLDHYAVFIYSGNENIILELIYRYASKIHIFSQPFINKLFLLVSVLTAVMLYYTEKSTSKDKNTTFFALIIGFVFLFLSDIIKGFSVISYIISQVVL